MSVTISPENCEYRAEGNAGIIVRLIKEGTVLRLRKCDDVHRSSRSASDVRKDLENQIKIIKNVWKPIIGEPFVNKPVIVFLKAEEIQTVNKAITENRPINRIRKSVKEEDTYAFMFPDYCSIPSSLKPIPTNGPVLSIEIKPKQGFMKEDFYQSNFSTLPVLICRYCMTQTFRLRRKMIASQSDYCPIDLFSGCQNRMLQSLKMLLKTPQNNLRIFKDQKLIFAEEKKSDLSELLSDFVPFEGVRCTDLLSDLLLQALVKPFPYGMENALVLPHHKNSQQCIHSKTDCCSEKDFHKLPQYCVLERILAIQLLDDLNIADLYQLYLQVKQNRDNRPDFIGCYSRSEIPPHVGELRKAPNETSYQYASRKVWEFLVALVMKDCSIMVTLRRLNSNSSNTIGSQNVISDKYGNSYIFSIAIADLDKKSLAKVEKVYNDLSMIIESLGD